MEPRGMRHAEKCCPGCICERPAFRGDRQFCVYAVSAQAPFLGILERVLVIATLSPLVGPFPLQAMDTPDPAAEPGRTV